MSTHNPSVSNKLKLHSQPYKDKIMNKIIRYTAVWALTLLTVSTITSCSKDDDNSNNSGILLSGKT